MVARVDDLNTAWETLMRVGLPDGPARLEPKGPFDDHEVAEAVARLAAISLAQRERELLLAWLSAFENYFPDRFRRTLGDLGLSLLASLGASEYDANRFVKFRRIAIEYLAVLI